MHAHGVKAAYSGVLGRVIAAHAAASASHAGSAARSAPRLVAVSKTKPLEDVLAVYAAGGRHFGENYVQELVEKSQQLLQLQVTTPGSYADIAWHFIGQLQSNKAKQLVAGVPQLYAVESVDSEKLATLLEKAVAGLARPPPERLRVFVQVNTSDEDQKGGVAMGGEAVQLARHITDACPHLQLAGLMTLGKLGESASVYFTRLYAERAAVAAALDRSPETLELSMGMSADFEDAIACGSTSVRVGSSIFGERSYPAKTAAAGVAATSTTASAATGAPDAATAASSASITSA